MTDLVRIPEDVVPGKRLGRHLEHDPRSRSFAVEAAPLGTLKSVRHKRLVPIYDQGNTGSCTGNACAGALSTRPYGHHFHEATALALYAGATRVDDFPGTFPGTDSGSTGLAVAKAAQQRGLISSYSHAFSLEAALTALQTSAVLVGISWRAGLDHPMADGLAHYVGSVRGGHELCMDEIDVERQHVGFSNSWGSDWGAAGRFFITWQDLGAALDDQGDVTVLVA